MMITRWFLSVFEISLSTALIALILILSAPLLNKRYAAKWKYWIWMFLAVRLLLPVNGSSLISWADAAFKNGLSLTDSTLSENGAPADWQPEMWEQGEGVTASEQEVWVPQMIVVQVPEQMTTPFIAQSNETDKGITLLDIAALVWLVGCLIFLFLYIFSYGRCRRRIRREGEVLQDGHILDLVLCLKEELHIRRAVSVVIYKEVASPMVIGFLRPILVLSGEAYSEEELYFILKHELIHFKRHDVLFKLLLAAASALHWFNPVVWLMQREASVDMELSCDERVVLGTGYEVRKAYTETLMKALHKKNAAKVVLSTQFYEGKRVMKKRFINILLRAGKKNGFIILVCAVVLTISMGALIGCSTAGKEDSADGMISGASDQTDGEDAALSDKQEGLAENARAENVTQNTDEPKVYAEIEDGEIRYQTRLDGIYRLEGENEERIYDGYAGLDNQLCVFEGRLYFMTDWMYEEGALDWQDTAVRWIDLQTLETGDLQMVREDGLIESFSIRQGIITICYAYPNNVVDSYMLYVDEDTAWNDKNILELSEAERQQYGQSLTQAVLQEQSVLTNVSNRVPNRNLTYLDMDGDGTSEEILLEPWRDAGGEGPDEPLRYYRLRVGEAVLETYGYSVDNTLRAFSLDGETLILAIYEDGPSADPLAHFYQYRDGWIVEVGSFETDIHSCRLEQGGMLSGAVLLEIANSDWIRVNWRMGENGMLEEVPQEYYDFIRGNWVELCEELPLHSEAGSGEVFTVEPQPVKFIQVSADRSWLLLETEDGQQGWLHVVDYQVEELDKNVMDVFIGGYLAG
ncbi:MAG: M56 family metallopeptidase [Candidatus Gastranaerophilales bacterium]|nr:M56 family metallopeptidase [Candidatus Gastranaerophilales bacterium]